MMVMMMICQSQQLNRGVITQVTCLQVVPKQGWKILGLVGEKFLKVLKSFF